MPEFDVPVVRKTLDVYRVTAKNTIGAAIAVGGLIQSGTPPMSSKELSRNVMQPRKPDEVHHHQDDDAPGVALEQGQPVVEDADVADDVVNLTPPRPVQGGKGKPKP